MDYRSNSNVGYYQNNNNNNNNTNNQGNNNKNRNRKNRNKNNNKNNNIPLSPSKNNVTNYDYLNSNSLDHQSFSNNTTTNSNSNNSNRNNNYNNYGKYNNFNNGIPNNQNNQNQRKFKYHHKRRNGSQGNYGYTNNNENFDIINDRLNKSLTPNSSFGENSKMQTSISLDNFDIVSALNNQKRSPIMANSYSFMSSNIPLTGQTTSPYKNTFNQRSATIAEQDDALETNKNLSSNQIILPKTEVFESSGNFNPDDTPVSCYSTPLNHLIESSKIIDSDQSRKKQKESNENTSSSEQGDSPKIKFEESMDSNDNTTTIKPNDESKKENATSSSSSSPDSKNSESQALVTASEGESSFGLEPNIEVTITNVAIETTFANELEQVVSSYGINMKTIKEIDHSETSTSVEMESNKSVDGSDSHFSSTSTASSTSTDMSSTYSNEKHNELKSESSSTTTSTCSTTSDESTTSTVSSTTDPSLNNSSPSESEKKLSEDEKRTEEHHSRSDEVFEETCKNQKDIDIVESTADLDHQKQANPENGEFEHMSTANQKEETKDRELAIKSDQKHLEAEIIIRPKLQEIDLADYENEVKKEIEKVSEQLADVDNSSQNENNVNIIPIMEEKQTASINENNGNVSFNNNKLDENKKSELAILNESIASIDSALKKENAKNGSQQKDPVVDCFSCNII